MAEIRAYADTRGVKPSTVLQRAAGYGGGMWKKWEAGAQCTLGTAETIRKYMRDNPSREGSLPEKRGNADTGFQGQGAA